jgi:hypothetical protein
MRFLTSATHQVAALISPFFFALWRKSYHLARCPCDETTEVRWWMYSEKICWAGGHSKNFSLKRQPETSRQPSELSGVETQEQIVKEICSEKFC